MLDLSHIKMLECVEELGPYRMPKVVLFNSSKLSPEEAFVKVQAGEYDDNIVVLEKRQWEALFLNRDTENSYATDNEIISEEEI